MERVEKLKKDFSDFESEDADILESLLSGLPSQYNYDYLVYSASNSFLEEKEIWEAEFYDVIKRFMMKKFDGAVERNYLRYLKSKNG